MSKVIFRQPGTISTKLPSVPAPGTAAGHLSYSEPDFGGNLLEVININE